MFNNAAEFALEQFLAIELSKINKTQPNIELSGIKKSAPEFGAKLAIFRDKILSSNTDVRLQTIYDCFDKVNEYRKHLAHATTAEAGMLDAGKNFQATGFVLLEWTKKDGTTAPQQPLTEEWLREVTESAAMPIALIQEYWIPPKS